VLLVLYNPSLSGFKYEFWRYIHAGLTPDKKYVGKVIPYDISSDDYWY
jgi:hypothetical protein